MNRAAKPKRLRAAAPVAAAAENLRNAQAAFQNRPEYETAVSLQRARRNHTAARNDTLKIVGGKEHVGLARD